MHCRSTCGSRTPPRAWPPSLAAFVLGPEGSLLHGAIVHLDAGATKTL